MKKILNPLRRASLVLFLTSALLTACADPLALPYMKNHANHDFSFDARIDSPNEEILAYRYGAGKGVGLSSDDNVRMFGRSPQVTGTYGYIPVGETLYVKWRSTGSQSHLKIISVHSATYGRVSLETDSGRIIFTPDRSFSSTAGTNPVNAQFSYDVLGGQDGQGGYRAYQERLAGHDGLQTANDGAYQRAA